MIVSTFSGSEKTPVFRRLLVKEIFIISIIMSIISNSFSLLTFENCQKSEVDEKCQGYEIGNKNKNSYDSSHKRKNTEIDSLKNFNANNTNKNQDLDLSSINSCSQKVTDGTCTSLIRKPKERKREDSKCKKNCSTCSNYNTCTACKKGFSLKNADCLRSITLHFVGDIMLDRRARNSVNLNFGGDYSALFNNFTYLKNADIAFGNFEGTASFLGEDMGDKYSFRMDPIVIPVIKEAGISIVSMANNHIGNWGPEAFTDTLVRLTQNGIPYTGAGFSKQEAEKPVIFEKYGMKIGFVGFSDVGPKNMEATSEKAGILLTSDPRFSEIIKNAAMQVDYLIVSMHFGQEYKTTNNSSQRKLAYKAIDNGAKLIIGHHPHVIQNTEVYKNAFIAYSLGNFLMDQYHAPNRLEGMLLEIKILKDGSMRVRKNISKQNILYQLDQFILGEEEEIS